jgi:hypothetical protein
MKNEIKADLLIQDYILDQTDWACESFKNFKWMVKNTSDTLNLKYLITGTRFLNETQLTFNQKIKIISEAMDKIRNRQDILDLKELAETKNSTLNSNNLNDFNFSEKCLSTIMAICVDKINRLSKSKDFISY